MNGGRGRALPILEQNRPRVNSGEKCDGGLEEVARRLGGKLAGAELEGNSRSELQLPCTESGSYLAEVCVAHEIIHGTEVYMVQHV